MSDSIRVVLTKDQRLDDKGNSLPPGTFVAEIQFNPELPGTLRNLGYLGSALSNCKVVDARAMPKIEPELHRQVHPPMPDIIDKG